MYYSWIAVKGREKADVFADLEVAEMDRAGDFFSCPLTYLETDKGWIVIISTRSGFVTANRLAKVSVGAEAMGLSLTDTAMANELTAYRDGVEVWSLDYDCDRQPQALLVKGSAPAEFAKANAEAIAEQAAIPEGDAPDYIFDVIPRTAEAICGFWLDEWEGAEPTWLEHDWPERNTRQPGGPGFLARLFGRR